MTPTTPRAPVARLLAALLATAGIALTTACDRRTDPMAQTNPTGTGSNAGQPGRGIGTGTGTGVGTTSPSPGMTAQAPGTGSGSNATGTAQKGSPAGGDTTGAKSGDPGAAGGAAGAKPVAANDVQFVAQAASSDQLEVQASKLALERTKNANVRNYAQKLVDDHSKNSAELKKLPAAASVGKLDAMTPQHSEQLRKLRDLQGANFDREYVQQIGVMAHQDAVALFQKAADEASDAQVKAFAKSKLPALRDHLKMAQSLASNLATGSDPGKPGAKGGTSAGAPGGAPGGASKSTGGTAPGGMGGTSK